TSVNVIVGQNAFLTLALLLAGVGLLGRRDFAAGAILGLLSYKPQLAIMVPVALLAARHWRAIAGAALSASFAVALSPALFGRDRRMAVLLTATLIAAPHSSPYDLVLLAAAALLVYRDMLDGIAIMPSPSLLLLPWFAPLALVPRSTVFGFGVPAVILGMLLI